MQPEAMVTVEPAPLIKIRIEYCGGTVDEYDIEEGAKHGLLDHYWDNPNVCSVSFIRKSESGTDV